MAPHSRIFLTRHAQAEHNVDLDYSSRYSVPSLTISLYSLGLPVADSPLTPLGRKQAASLAPRIPKLQQQVDLVVTSPLQRTLQTTLLGWGPAVRRLGIQDVVCLPEAQECNDFPCDTGSAREELEKDPEFAGFDFSRLTPDWTSKTGFWAPDAGTIAHRAQTVRRFLRERPEKDIALVAHGDFLRQITCDVHGPSEYMWKNVEVQVFRFDSETVDQNDCFLQLEEVVAAAGGYGPTSTERDIDGEANGKL